MHWDLKNRYQIMKKRMLISIRDELQRSNLEETLMDTVYNGFSSLFVPWEIAVLHFLQRALTIDSLQKK